MIEPLRQIKRPASLVADGPRGLLQLPLRTAVLRPKRSGRQIYGGRKKPRIQMDQILGLVRNFSVYYVFLQGTLTSCRTKKDQFHENWSAK